MNTRYEWHTPTEDAVQSGYGKDIMVLVDTNTGAIVGHVNMKSWDGGFGCSVRGAYGKHHYFTIEQAQRAVERAQTSMWTRFRMWWSTL